MQKQRAFTLIELLITTLMFVVVVGYAVVIFSSTVGLSSRAQRSAGAAGQSRQAMDILSRAFAQSVPASPAVVLASSEAGTEGSVLIFTVTIPTSTGTPSSTSEQRAYCAAGVGNGRYRLAQFTIVGTYSGGTSSLACNAGAIGGRFSGGTVTGPTFLTDNNTNVTRFSAVPVQYGVGVPVPNPAALQLTLTSIFDLTVGNSGATERADSAGTSHPITVQATAARNFPYNRQPFSGL